MSTIDHSAEAQKHYEEAVEANQNGKWETARFEMQLAKFHTEAALVEQQRIGNIIAAHVLSTPIHGEQHTLLESMPNAVADVVFEGLGL